MFAIFDNVGTERAKNKAPMWNAPVPEMVWVEATYASY